MEQEQHHLLLAHLLHELAEEEVLLVLVQAVQVEQEAVEMEPLTLIQQGGQVYKQEQLTLAAAAEVVVEILDQQFQVGQVSL